MAVDETSGSTDSSIVSGTKHRLGDFHSQSRRGSIVKERYLLLYLRTCFSFLFFCCSIVCLFLLCRVSAQHFPWKLGGVTTFVRHKRESKEGCA